LLGAVIQSLRVKPWPLDKSSFDLFGLGPDVLGP